jgi:hypothetical protein
MGKRIQRLMHAWNAFKNNNLMSDWGPGIGNASYGPGRMDRTRLTIGNEQSIIASIVNRIGIDAAAIDMRHVRLDSDGRYTDDVDSGLQNCLTLQANVDQGARAFRQDAVMTLLDLGTIAMVPVDTTENPSITGAFDIKTLRVGRIVAWYPYHVRVSLYNETKSRRQEITLEKKFVAIVENPLYSVMNEPISTLRRLIRKLNMLDAVDEQSSSGKLDLIIQLPYVVKSEARRAQAEQRAKDIEFQLKGSKYGIAYTDGSEKITQLNRPAENNLLEQITYLTSMLYSQLGLTETVMNGTADEPTMLNYYARTIDPILAAMTESMRAAFLTKTGRSQGQSVLYFRDPFKLVPLEKMGVVVDKFSRNKIMTANELRQAMGIKPSKDPSADQLANANMPTPPAGPNAPVPPVDPNAPPAPVDPNVPADSGAASSDESSQIFNDAFDQANSSIDSILSELGATANASG